MRFVLFLLCATAQGQIDLSVLKARIAELDTKNQNPWCLQQQGNELAWLVKYTDRRIDAESLARQIKGDLDRGYLKPGTDTQSEKDGSWGSCYAEWFLKLDTSVDHIRDLAHQGKTPRFTPKFLDRINSPQLLNDYLYSILMSDLAKRKVDHRKELNYSVPGLVRLVLKDLPRNYRYHPELKHTLLSFIEKWQNPDTGCWGAWYVEGDDVRKTDDLSITFHLASYLDGNIRYRGKIAKTVYQNRVQEYPYGLREDGQYTTHHNYDAVRLFRYGWIELSEGDKPPIQKEIEAMLQHCLTVALQPDGTFAMSAADDSVADAYYFGISFLDETGYFKREKRFWTTQEFPAAEETRQRILKKIRSIPNPSLMLKDAIQKLS